LHPPRTPVFSPIPFLLTSLRGPLKDLPHRTNNMLSSLLTQPFYFPPPFSFLLKKSCNPFPSCFLLGDGLSLLLSPCFFLSMALAPFPLDLFAESGSPLLPRGTFDLAALPRFQLKPPSRGLFPSPPLFFYFTDCFPPGIFFSRAGKCHRCFFRYSGPLPYPSRLFPLRSIAVSDFYFCPPIR